jgi:TolB-like protein
VAPVVQGPQAPGARSYRRTGAEIENSVAVLYFENLSRSEQDEYFRDGITEDVITEIAKIDNLRVFPRSAVFAFRDRPLAVDQVGRQLSAAFVLEGSFRRAGHSVRITARLAESCTSHSLWAERYDFHIDDVFAIQDAVAKNIARALRVLFGAKGSVAMVPSEPAEKLTLPWPAVPRPARKPVNAQPLLRH